MSIPEYTDFYYFFFQIKFCSFNLGSIYNRLKLLRQYICGTCFTYLNLTPRVFLRIHHYDVDYVSSDICYVQGSKVSTSLVVESKALIKYFGRITCYPEFSRSCGRVNLFREKTYHFDKALIFDYDIILYVTKVAHHRFFYHF